jgi:amidase
LVTYVLSGGRQNAGGRDLKRREFLQLAAGATLGIAAKRNAPDLSFAIHDDPAKLPTDLTLLDAAGMGALLRKRKVSSVELLKSHLAQIDRENKRLNAIVTLDPEQAMARARLADEALRKGELWGPFHGVPVTFKDALSTAGMRTTAGFPPLKDYIPAEDATVVARLKSAGAIVLGKTNMPTLAAGYYTDNPIFGMSNNPWNVGFSPGGSTGGGAAAVASGMSPLEIGSDIAGSVRWPAHCCGVFTLKPTEWRVPWTGHIPELPGHIRGVRHMLVVGPLARSVRDLELALRVIAGADHKIWEIPPVSLSESGPISLTGLRVAYVPRFGDLPINSESLAGLDGLIKDLASHGVQVERTEIAGFDFDKADKLLDSLVRAESPDRPNSKPVTMRDYINLLSIKDALTACMDDFLSRFDVLICPSGARQAFKHESDPKTVAIDEREVDYDTAAGWYVRPFSVTGNPAVVLPLLRCKDGLPIGVQLVGRRWTEMRLLAIASAVGEVTSGFHRPPMA